MKTFYSIVTVWAETPITTVDFPDLTRAFAEFKFRRNLAHHFEGAITDVRIIRISKHQILDITPPSDLPDLKD